jgi:hypothetical protein
MSKKIIGFSLALIILSGTSLALLPAQAQPTSIINTADESYAEGDYGLDDFIILAIRVSQMILGLIGSLSLIMFIYGGFTFLISAGSAEKVSQANKIILAAVIGLAIVFSSYLIIKFALSSIGLNWDGSNSKPTPTAAARLARL